MAGVPTYQTDPDKFCKGGLSDEALVFETQQCGIFFLHSDWQKQKHVLVTGASDGIVNIRERLTVLQLYHDVEKGTSDINELKIWNGIMLPEIKVLNCFLNYVKVEIRILQSEIQSSYALFEKMK